MNANRNARATDKLMIKCRLRHRQKKALSDSNSAEIVDWGEVVPSGQLVTPKSIDKRASGRKRHLGRHDRSRMHKYNQLKRQLFANFGPSRARKLMSNRTALNDELRSLRSFHWSPWEREFRLFRLLRELNRSHSHSPNSPRKKTTVRKYKKLQACQGLATSFRSRRSDSIPLGAGLLPAQGQTRSPKSRR